MHYERTVFMIFSIAEDSRCRKKVVIYDSSAYKTVLISICQNYSLNLKLLLFYIVFKGVIQRKTVGDIKKSSYLPIIYLELHLKQQI